MNAEKVGLGLTVYVLIKTNQHTESWSKAFQRIQDVPEVLESYRMSGEVDYLLKAVVSDMAGYDRLYKKLIAVDLFDVSSASSWKRLNIRRPCHCAKAWKEFAMVLLVALQVGRKSRATGSRVHPHPSQLGFGDREVSLMKAKLRPLVVQ